MALLRCQDQDHKTLIESYAEYESGSELFRTKGVDMIHLIKEINQDLAEVDVYAFTSHDNLCLVAENHTSSKVQVVITAHGYGLGYIIQYFMPDKVAPWEHARVMGESKTMRGAVEMIWTAMDQSQGWHDSPEVERILQEKLAK